MASHQQHGTPHHCRKIHAVQKRFGKFLWNVPCCHSARSNYCCCCDVLEQTFKVDEEHGILTIDEIKKICKEVFDKYDVEFAYLFGSYAKGKQKPTSDVDIMVCTDITGLDFFGLIEELRENLHKKVDLIPLNDIVPGSELLTEILIANTRIYG